MRPDLDQVEALAGERDALWSRLQGVTFLTDDEKRAAAGYGELPVGAAFGGRLPAGESPNANESASRAGRG